MHPNDKICVGMTAHGYLWDMEFRSLPVGSGRSLVKMSKHFLNFAWRDPVLVLLVLRVQYHSWTHPAGSPRRREILETMLRNARDLQGLTIRATDGEIGAVEQLYFDYETWAIRYFTVNTGNWLDGQLALTAPIGQPDWQSKRLDVLLTKTEVEKSPCIAAHQTQARLHESAQEVTGRYIEASDGEIGHLDGFVFDDQTWVLRYLEVVTRNWWHRKKVLVSLEWIDQTSSTDSKICVGLSRDAIKNAPEYVESRLITQEYESQICSHYGRPPYRRPTKHAAASSRPAFGARASGSLWTRAAHDHAEVQL